METTSGINSRIGRHTLVWRKKFNIWWRNLISFFGELRKHPLAMLGGLIVIVYLFAAIFADQITVHDPTTGNLRNRLVPPVWNSEGSWDYPLGTDAQGRDILTRVIYGSRVSLAVGLISVGISVVIGLALGVFSGYYRGRFDGIVSRFADLLLAFPFLIFAIGMMAFLGPGFTNLILALTFKGWVEFFRLSRGEMLSEKTNEYVEAAKVTGHSHLSIIGTRDSTQYHSSGFRPGYLEDWIYDYYGSQPELPGIRYSTAYSGMGFNGRCRQGLHACSTLGVDRARIGDRYPGFIDQPFW